MSMEACDMSKAEGKRFEDVIGSIEGVTLKERTGSQLHFRMYINQRMSESPIEALELSVRSYNVLRRAGFHTIGDLTDAIADGMELLKIRNCGKKSAREIMEQLFLFQYASFDERRKKAFLREVRELNSTIKQ